MISLSNVNKYYNEGKENEIHVLSNISLEFSEYGMVGIFGKSGCGKTTLLNAIGGLTTIYDGEIHIGEGDITKNSDYIRNQYIGYIFQNYCLDYQKTVYENVADALKLAGVTDKNEIYRRVENVLLCVGMERYVKRYPNTLSGGQQQRVAIARALVKNPRIILADEPTGNLDAKNTIQIMKLLKRISKKQLVILVTHEQELIRNYCDSVVEMSDGSIKNVYDNNTEMHQDEKESNIIYVNELEERENNLEIGKILYYGELPKEKLEIAIVNYAGKIYLKVNASNVKVINQNSELEIRKRADAENRKEDCCDDEKDMAIDEITDIREDKIGKLFDWKDSIVVAWKNIVTMKGSHKFLCLFLFVFSLIIVLLSAFYGRDIEKVINADSLNNAHSFYAYIPDEKTAIELIGVIGSVKSGIDNVEFTREKILGDQKFYIELPNFSSSLENSFKDFIVMTFHGTLFPIRVAYNSESICGKAINLDNKEAIITSAVADCILENDTLDLFVDYESIIGFNAKSLDGGNSFEIVGIVNSEEYAIYFDDSYFAKKWYKECCSANVAVADEYNSIVESGNVILRVNSDYIEKKPNVGETVTINGKELEVSKVIDVNYSYEEWLSDNDIVKKTEEELECSKYEYLDYYYLDYKDYVSYCENNQQNVEYDLYKKLIAENNKEAWYISIMELSGLSDYYVAAKFKEDHNRYPSEDELEEAMYIYESPYDKLERIMVDRDEQYIYEYTYVLNQEDYINISNGYGKSIGYGMNNENFDSYAIIHSIDVDVTEAYLQENFEGINPIESLEKAYLTPAMLRGLEIEQYKKDIIVSLIVWIMFICVISVCVYILMRSNMMRDISQVGMYRCIGVTRKNIIFKYFVENLTTIFISAGMGYFVISFVLWYLQSGKYSYLVNSMFYYPWWLGIFVFIFVMSILICCSLLPIVMLLRKSPSEIMAKYDV